VAYLRNRTVNLLNLHFGIQSLAMNAGAVFLLRAAGVGHAAACLALALMTVAGAPLSMGILLALVGVPPQVILVRRHYAEAAAA
jgi:hypothetical protein